MTDELTRQDVVLRPLAAEPVEKVASVAPEYKFRGVEKLKVELL